MSGPAKPPPGGLTLEHFESMASDAGQWLWGTVQGAANRHASLSQIIVDAVIGMIPLVGDVTAARDLVIVSVRMVDDPKSREDKWEWILLVVLVFALIPVIGGVVKGAGRLTLGAAREAAALAGAARAARMAEVGRDIVAFLNRIGVGHAERWLLELNFAKHQAQVLERFNGLLNTISRALGQIQAKLGAVLGDAMLKRIDTLRKGLAGLRTQAEKMIPQALKDLDATLSEIQRYIRSGGETTSRTVAHTAVAGDKAAVHLAEEARLEEGLGAHATRRGGIAQNPVDLGEAAKRGLYEQKPGYPALRGSDVATFGGKVVNRGLQKDEQIYRFFGPGGATFEVSVGESFAPGRSAEYAAFWGLGPAPATAREWREKAAVLDEWNRDGYVLIGTIQESDRLKACTGVIAEQRSSQIFGQYLEGGGKQALLKLEQDVYDALKHHGQIVIKTNQEMQVVLGGVHWTIRPTGWPDANGVWGYGAALVRATTRAVRLGAREYESKSQ